MKADKNYRMSKSTKKLLSTFKDKETRNHYKRIMIGAELDNEANKKKQSRPKSDE